MKPRVDTPGDAGVTLLEMLVVLAILALAALVLAPMVGGARAQVETRAVVSDVAAMVRSARAEALRTSIEHLVTFDVDARTVASGSATLRLPGALAITAEVAHAERLGTSTARIRFYADGSSSGGRVLLAAGRSHSALTVDPLTGVISVARGP